MSALLIASAWAIAVAADGEVSVAPSLLHAQNTGEPIRTTLAVYNSSDGALVVRGRAEHIDPGQCDFQTLAGTVVEWVEITPTELAPGARTRVPVLITPDSQSARAAMLWLDVAPTTAEPALAVIGIPVLVDAAEPAEGGVIEEIRVIAPTQATPLGVSAAVRNTGNSHARISLSAALFDAEDRFVVRVPTTESVWLMPGQRCRVSSHWSGWMEPGAWTVRTQVSGLQAEQLSTDFIVH